MLFIVWLIRFSYIKCYLCGRVSYRLKVTKESVNRMEKKVYFAGSIRGGREDAAVYKRIIDYINATDTVLTEHIGLGSLSVKTRTKRMMSIYMSVIQSGLGHPMC